MATDVSAITGAEAACIFTRVAEKDDPPCCEPVDDHVPDPGGGGRKMPPPVGRYVEAEIPPPPAPPPSAPPPRREGIEGALAPRVVGRVGLGSADPGLGMADALAASLDFAIPEDAPPAEGTMRMVEVETCD